MAERIDVFISSTSRDLKAYRDAATQVILRLGLHPIIMEAFNPTDSNALQLCYDKVQEAEIFIGIYAYRYGFTPGSGMTYLTADGKPHAGDSHKSITHMEYLWAVERNLPMLLFVVSDTDADENPLAWPVPFIEGEPGKTSLKEFKDWIMTEHVVGFFYSPNHLSLQIATGLNEIVNNIRQSQLDAEIKATRDRLVLLAEDRQQARKRKVVGERLGNVFQFLDRVDEQQRICQLLSDPNTRLVSVISRGGMGKTALATKVLSYFEDSQTPFADSQIEVDGIIYLSTRSSTTISLERVFLSFGQLLSRESEMGNLWNSTSLSLREKVAALLDMVHDGTYILMLDNLEDLLDARGTLTDPELHTLLEVAAVTNHAVRILITSRIALTAPPEAIHVNHEISLFEGLPEQEGVKLLRSLDVNGEFGLRDAPETQLVKAVELVNGVPRALEVICSILANDPVLTLEELLTRNAIFQHADFVERLVKENYGYIDANARRVLEALAVYGHPVEVVAVDYMLKPFLPGLATRDTLNQLVKTHVISAERATRTYYLHPIDADYLYSQLAPNGEYSRQTLNQLAAEYYELISLSPDKWRSLEDLQPHFMHYEHALCAENYDFAAQAINQVSEQLNIWGYAQRNLQMLQALEGKIIDPIMAARFHNNLAYIYALQNDAPEAINYFNKALDAANNQTAKAWLQIRFETLVGIGTTYRKTGRYQEAADHFHQAIDFKRSNPLLSDQIEPLAALGYVSYDLGHSEQAIQYISKALEEAQKRQDVLEIGFANLYLSIVYSAHAKWEQAIACHHQSIDAANQVNAARLRCACQVELTKTLIRTGQLDQAETALHTAQAIAEEIQSPEHFQYVQFMLGHYLLKRQRLNEALEVIQAAAQITSHWLDFEVALLQGILLARRADNVSARQIFEKALDYSRQLSPEYFYAEYFSSITNAGLALVVPSEQTTYIHKAQSALEEAIPKSAPLGIILEFAELLHELDPLDADGILIPLHRLLSASTDSHQ